MYHDTSKIDTYGFLANESGLLKVRGAVSSFLHPAVGTRLTRLSRCCCQLGGSDFHGIDANTECAPGAIPFPRKQVNAFLEHAKSVWERPLRERLVAMVATAKERSMADGEAAASSSAAPEELLVWKEQLAGAQQVCAALGATLETLEDADSPSLYRTLRVVVR